MSEDDRRAARAITRRKRWTADTHVQLTIEDGATDRLDRLIAEARATLAKAIALADEGGYEITAIAGMFSGGNDSTTLAHLFRSQVTHYIHANTQIGAEPTRQFVRDTAARWNVPLIEERPPGHTYEDLVLRNCPSVSTRAKYPYVYQGGFPGAADHRLVFGRLKDKAISKIRRRLNPNPTRQRCIFIEGRRASESQARTKMAELGTLAPVTVQGSVIRIAPLIDWTKLDLNDYRRRFPDVPRNEVADLMHMSMECACGCYAREGEMDEMETWLPSLADYIHGLEWRAARLGLDIHPKRLRWGFQNRGKCASGLCNT